MKYHKCLRSDGPQCCHCIMSDIGLFFWGPYSDLHRHHWFLWKPKPQAYVILALCGKLSLWEIESPTCKACRDGVMFNGAYVITGLWHSTHTPSCASSSYPSVPCQICFVPHVVALVNLADVSQSPVYVSHLRLSHCQLYTCLKASISPRTSQSPLSCVSSEEPS